MSTSDTAIPTSVNATELLAHGKPFIEFPRYSIFNLRHQILPGEKVGGKAVVPEQNASESIAGVVDSNAPENFSQWLSTRLQIGQPFVIQDFDKLPQWNKKLFSLDGLIEHSTKKNIPIRNCSTNRDLSFTLKKFAEASERSYREFKNLYARDLRCPDSWLEQYRPVLCFGTDFSSQAKYDSFAAARGASPHVDWLNIEPEDLKKADFPVYICEQWPGDLVVFPPATAHQVWNLGNVSTKVVWNILHPLSLDAGLHYVQPPFNRLCHPDVARSNLSLACAMLSLLREDRPATIPPDLPLLTKLFKQMAQDETIDDRPATTITLVPIPETAIATCNFCGTAIWNRHLRCDQCQDFDLCLMCYLSGRSCEHPSSYSWAEIVPQETCTRVVLRAESILGYDISKSSEGSRIPDQRKTLGTACCHFPSAYVKAEKPASKRRVRPGDPRGKNMGFTDNVFDQKKRNTPALPTSPTYTSPPAARQHKRSISSCSTAQQSLLSAPPRRATASAITLPTLSTPELTHSSIVHGRRDSTVEVISDGTPHARSKMRRLSIVSRDTTPKPHPEVPSGRTLLGIDYITQRSSSNDDQLSLPPLKGSSRSSGPFTTASPSTISRQSMSHDGGMATLATLASTREKEQVSLTSSSSIGDAPRYVDRDPRGEGSSDTMALMPQPGAHYQHQAYIPPHYQGNPPSQLMPPSFGVLPNPKQPPAHYQPPSGAGSAFFSGPQATSTSTPRSTSMTLPSNPNPPSSATNPIPALETQLHRLRQYSEELLSLSLYNSHRLLQDEIQRLEGILLLAKKDRSERVLRNLEIEFPALINIHEGLKREGARLGYF
ncbi:ZZ type zinc finger protein [Arthroderma uncinatum]|uniref:ZZ type zinc finger protein n=1 Tax=Arthroderma uncinatum TaxID=74035 RepID=UPI00144ADD28|nr:ZZ type zinc finger protein [Arthroderma uncinatum]KAF3482911.1 ZZ type zinc finger protein [Arthroderma uncinatum]